MNNEETIQLEYCSNEWLLERFQLCCNDYIQLANMFLYELSENRRIQIEFLKRELLLERERLSSMILWRMMAFTQKL